MCHKSWDTYSQEVFLNVMQEIWNNRIVKNSDLYSIDMFSSVFLSIILLYYFYLPTLLV